MEDEAISVLNVMMEKDILTASDVKALRKQAEAEDKDAILKYLDTSNWYFLCKNCNARINRVALYQLA